MAHSMRRHKHTFFSFIYLLLTTIVTGSYHIYARQQHTTRYDPRAYQHGIDIIKRPDGRYLLIWASSGNPPKGADPNREWSHDVYYALINPAKPRIAPVQLISAPGAQEPASAAMTTDGRIMITMEDAYQANNELVQSYAIYDASMKPVKDYQNIILDGGHSGHVAAVNNRFVVFFSEGWVDGGGVDGLGSGDDVLLSVYDSQGQLLTRQDISVGNQTRDWWPQIAGSEKHAILLWQRFIENKTVARLMYKVFDPVRQRWVKQTTELVNTLKYYTYAAQYIPSLKLFFVTGANHPGKGFAFLISNDGNIVAQSTVLPPIVREAQPAVSEIKNGRVTIVYPTHPGALAVVSISRSDIQLVNTVPVLKHWFTSGTDGVFLNDNNVFFASLSPHGIKQIIVNLKQ